MTSKRKLDCNLADQTLPPGFRATKPPLSFIDSPYAGRSHGYHQLTRRSVNGPVHTSPKAGQWVSPQFENTTPRRSGAGKSSRLASKRCRGIPKPPKLHLVGTEHRSRQQHSSRRKPSLTLMSSKQRTSHCPGLERAVNASSFCDSSSPPHTAQHACSTRSSNVMDAGMHLEPSWEHHVQHMVPVPEEDYDPASVLVAETPLSDRNRRARRTSLTARSCKKIIPASPCSSTHQWATTCTGQEENS